MRSIKDKTLQLLENVAVAADLESVVSFNHANTGTIYISDPNTPTVFAIVTFNFQPGTMTLTANVSNRQLLSQPDRPDYHDWFMDNSDGWTISRFILVLGEALAGNLLPIRT